MSCGEGGDLFWQKDLLLGFGRSMMILNLKIWIFARRGMWRVDAIFERELYFIVLIVLFGFVIFVLICIFISLSLLCDFPQIFSAGVISKLSTFCTNFFTYLTIWDYLHFRLFRDANVKSLTIFSYSSEPQWTFYVVPVGWRGV